MYSPVMGKENLSKTTGGSSFGFSVLDGFSSVLSPTDGTSDDGVSLIVSCAIPITAVKTNTTTPININNSFFFIFNLSYSF